MNYELDGARAKVVNRTHRVIRAQAEAMNSRRKVQRALWVPLALCASALVALMWHGWEMMAPEIEGAETSIMNAEPGALMPVLLMWFLPLTFAAGVAVFVMRVGSDEGRN